MSRIQRLLVVAFAVMGVAFLMPHIALAQDQFPNVPDDSVSVVQLWMIAFGILTTVFASLMRLLPVQDLPDIAKKGIVVVTSLVLAALGLAVQNDLFPVEFVKSALTILIVASGIYALLGKMIQDSIAGVKTIAVKEGTSTLVPIPPSAVVDPGH